MESGLLIDLYQPTVWVFIMTNLQNEDDVIYLNGDIFDSYEPDHNNPIFLSKAAVDDLIRITREYFLKGNTNV